MKSPPCWKLADSGSGSPGSSSPRKQNRLEGKKKSEIEEKMGLPSVTSYSARKDGKKNK